MDPLKQEIINIGRAMLALGFQNTHSGNISARSGEEMYITKTGSLKGHLEERDICKPGLYEPGYGLFQTSSETGEHRSVLHFANAMIHAHILSVVMLSYMEEEIRAVDFWGKRYLGEVPVKAFELPIGSREMEEQIPEILKERAIMVVKTHGPFVRGENLSQAFFLMCLLNQTSEILLDLHQLGIRRSDSDVQYPEFMLQEEQFRYAGDGFDTDSILNRQFLRTGRDLFYLKLSSYRTGSLSVLDGDEMIYSPALSVPDPELFDIQRISLKEENTDYLKSLHRAVYKHSHAKAALFTISPEALVQAAWSRHRGSNRIIPCDAEGGHLYPAIPVVDPSISLQEVVEKAVRYKMAVIRGMGVLAVGHTPGHVIHQNSSIKNICILKTRLQILEKLGRIECADDWACKRGKDW